MRSFFKTSFMLFLISNANTQTLYMLKQWHLLPKVSTDDIQVSKKIAQYKNQKDLYFKTLSLIKDKKITYLFAEGCAKEEVLPSFKPTFNSWNYEKLDRIKNTEDYADVLTHIPLKIEVAKKDDIKTLCVDDEALIEKNQLVLSDIRAYVGYFLRLKEFKEKGDKISYERYSKSLLEEEKKINVKSEEAINYARKKALLAVQDLKTVVAKREEAMVNNIRGLKLLGTDGAAFIIGGVHAQSLQEKLSALGFKVEIYTPEGYVDTDKGLIEEIERKLQ